MGRYLALRSEYLTLFREEFGSSAKDRLDGLETDLAESDPWISPRWESPAPRPTTSDEMDVLLTVFAHQQFGIQEAVLRQEAFARMVFPLHPGARCRERLE